MAVTMVLGKLSEEGGPFPGHLACLRKELKFSALNYFWLRCSSKGERDRPWKSVASVEITNEESAGGGGGGSGSRAPPERPRYRRWGEGEETRQHCRDTRQKAKAGGKRTKDPRRGSQEKSGIREEKV